MMENRLNSSERSTSEQCCIIENPQDLLLESRAFEQTDRVTTSQRAAE